VKATVSAGDIYGTVSNSTAGGSPVVTTVTVTWDSGELDSGLSAVWTGILTPGNPSIPGGVTLSDLQKLHALTESATRIDAAADLLDPANRTIGDILTETSAGTMGAIAAVAATQYLKSTGIASLPAYSKLRLSDTGVNIYTKEVTGTGNTDVTLGYQPSVCIVLAANDTGWSIGFDVGSSTRGFLLFATDSTTITKALSIAGTGTHSFHVRNYANSSSASGAITMRSDGYRITVDQHNVNIDVVILALP
jgi:hypothetical protein